MSGLRGRLAASLAAAALLGVVVTVAVAALLVRGRVADTALTALGRQADTAAGVLADGGRIPGRGRAGAGGDGATGAAAGLPVLRVRQGRLRAAPKLAGPVASAVAATGRDAGTLEDPDGGRTLLYAARDVAGGGRVVLVRTARLAADWRPYVWSLVLAGVLGALAAAGLGLVVARRLARPVRRLRHATVAVAAGDAARVPEEGPAELADLSAAFNRMAGDVAAARERERSFLLSVSHELKTPLTAVRAWAEGLADDAVDPAEAGAVIGAEAQRLERLVGDLLELGRLERDGFAVAAAPADLAAVAAAASTRFAARAAAAGVTLVVEPGEGWATADAGRVLQVLTNLVDNAMRVTPAGGRVTLTVAPGVVTVADTGPGLPAADLPHAFERFHLHDRHGAPDGSGLGLALVAELARAMGGEARVESTAGSGARFTLALPPVAAPALA